MGEQGAAGRGLHGALPSPSEGRLQLLVLPGGQSPRRRGPHRADVPAGVPALRTGPARERGAADPPERRSERRGRTLASITDAAAEELDAWEISAMRDPRNWVRPAVAVSAGTVAGVGLVVLRARAKGKKRRDQSSDPLEFAEHI